MGPIFRVLELQAIFADPCSGFDCFLPSIPTLFSLDGCDARFLWQEYFYSIVRDQLAL